MSPETLQKVLGSELLPGPSGGMTPPAGLSIDSRTVQPGDVFFALPGSNRDGHDFVTAVFSKGASAAVINRAFRNRFASDRPGPLFVVDDTHQALLSLAQYLRRSSSAAFAGVTGSNGKTTTKEMLYAIMAVRHRTYRSPGNLNNLYGLPIALGRMPEDIRYAIFELGISYPGEMSRLAAIVQPEIGIITNISRAHLETLKTLDNIVKAKFELIDFLSSRATVVLNADDSRLTAEARRRGLEFVGFGIDHTCRFRAENIRQTSDDMILFETDGSTIRLPLLGRANVYNALAAIAASSVWGAGPNDWVAGLAGFKPIDMRLTLEHHAGLDLLVDCYNANPESVKEALRTLQAMKAQGRKLAVLGDMLELGKLSATLHQEIGRIAAAAGLDFLLCLGPQSAATVSAAKAAGMAPDRVIHCLTHQELLESLLRLVTTGDLILFKGSRGMELEKIVVGLKGSAFTSN